MRLHLKFAASLDVEARTYSHPRLQRTSDSRRATGGMYRLERLANHVPQAQDGILGLRPHWGCLGGSEEQRGILLEAALHVLRAPPPSPTSSLPCVVSEAARGEVVCGNPQDAG